MKHSSSIAAVFLLALCNPTRVNLVSAVNKVEDGERKKEERDNNESNIHPYQISPMSDHEKEQRTMIESKMANGNIPAMQGIPNDNGTREADEGRYIVKYKEGSLEYLNRLTIAEANESDGGERCFRKLTRSSPDSADSFYKAKRENFLPRVMAEIINVDTEEEAAEWETHNDVEYIERDTKVYMMQSFIDDVETTPYGITQVQALLVNDEFTINRKVCVIDSGYDLTHPDLQNEFVTGNGAEGGASRWDEDALWHGTHCTGTIAAIGNNDKGIVGVVRSGTMNLHIVRVFDANASWVWTSGLIQAVEECVAAGSNVVSMSLGGKDFSQISADAYQHILDKDNVLLVAAAGNSGRTSYTYPASYDAVISVAAVDTNGNKARFSQYNDQVDIAAPGVAINSTIPGAAMYLSLSGTSMAVPHVAGVAALIWSHAPSKSATQVWEALTATAKKRDGISVRNNKYGHGVVQAEAAKLYLEESSVQPNLSLLRPRDDDEPRPWNNEPMQLHKPRTSKKSKSSKSQQSKTSKTSWSYNSKSSKTQKSRKSKIRSYH